LLAWLLVPVIAATAASTPPPALAQAATPATTVGGDWTQFHNDPVHSGYNAAETTISAANVANLGVAWTAATGNSIESSPAVSNGVVYVGSDDGKLYAYAVGCNSGGGTCTPLWTATTGDQIFSSPAVANGVVYVGSEDGKLYAYAVGCASGGGTCTPLWTATTGDMIFSSPAVADGVVYVGSYDHELYAYAVGCASGGGTCTPLWTATTGGSIDSSPAVANGVVYVGSEDGKLYAYAVGCASGGGTCTPLWTATTGSSIGSSPAVANGVVYVGSTDHKLYAYAVGCASSGGTCTPLWTATTGGSIGSSPAVANGVVYVGSYDGKLSAYAVGCASSGGTCTPLWTATTGGGIGSSPAVANGVVYVGSYDHKLYAYAVGCASGGGTCTPLWTATTGNWIDSSPAVSNGVVYVGSGDHKLYAFGLPGATYHALTPTRVLDTRNGTGGLSGPFTNHTARTFQVTGGGVPSGAIAVTGNLTVTGQTSSGYLFIGPVATNNPTSSTLNFPVGDDRANAVTVALSGTGTLSITFVAPSNGPTAHAIFDVTGYFTPDTTGATYHALSPTRALDTRDGTGGLAGPFTNHAARTFTVSGVPSGAIAVTGNLTVTGQTSSGYLFIGPVAMNNPGSSTLNFPVGDDRANAVTVALGAGGTLSITFVAPSNGPTAHAIFDVTGYFTPDTSGATYHALSPTRALDTRNGTGGLGGPFTNHAARTFTVAGVPSGAVAVTGNLTVTGQTSGGYLSIGPVATNNPGSSTLNFPVGDDRANAVTVALSGTGTLSITFVAPSNGPSAHAIFDVTGYFTP
jgi:outer membrane protein assembly factor BamB